MTFKNRVHIDNKKAALILDKIIYKKIFESNYRRQQNIIILCIGTDRSTGDCLGPLTGTFLNKQENLPAKTIGCLEKPVHAKNLDKTLSDLKKYYRESFIIAIDAGLGKQSSVGYIDVKTGPIHPGSGVNKNLSQVGDMHITGLVNVSGYMEYLVLQSTRLRHVIKMAETIALGLGKTIGKVKQRQKIAD